MSSNSVVQNCCPGVSVWPAGAEYVNEQWKEVRVCVCGGAGPPVSASTTICEEQCDECL